MRIGLSGGAATVDRMIEQVVEAERDGFTSMWFAGAIGGDPLVVLPLAGRATKSIELGTSVVQTYPRHPVQMAQTAAAVGAAIGGGRFTLGIGVSHRPVIENTYGLDYNQRARHLDEYVQVLTALLQEGKVSFKGDEYQAMAQIGMRPDVPVPVVVAALAEKALDSAGTYTAGTITWMANRRAIEDFVAPRLREAAAAAGRTNPRVVVGLPIAVCDDIDAGRAAASQQFATYGMLPNYKRILDRGGVDGPADAAIVGPEDDVANELRALLDAGATDIWAAIFPVGEDRRASRQRTHALLKELAST
jgi:F420-dependent oxidoreductase-like protein